MRWKSSPARVRPSVLRYLTKSNRLLEEGCAMWGDAHLFIICRFYLFSINLCPFLFIPLPSPIPVFYRILLKNNQLQLRVSSGIGLAHHRHWRFMSMNNNHTDLRLLTLADAAAILQLSKRTLIKMIQKKDVPAFKVGGQWRIRESQFKKWVEHKEN